MNYKYPPIYKYIILLILITTFLRYYKVITKDNFLLIAGIFTYMVFLFDFVLIKNHPSLLTDDMDDNEEFCGNVASKKIIYVKKNKKKDIVVDEDKFEKELDELNKQIEDTESENLTEEIQKQLDELDL